MAGGPASQAGTTTASAAPRSPAARPAAAGATGARPGAAPARVVGSTVMHGDLRRKVRFRAGVRDLCFGLGIASLGVVLNTLLPVYVGSADGTRVAGVGLLAVGLVYAGYGAYGMLANRAPSANSKPAKRSRLTP